MDELLTYLFRRMKRHIKKGSHSITGEKNGSLSYLVGAIEFTSYENMMTMKSLYEFYFHCRNKEPLIYWNDRLYRNGIPLSHYTLEIYSQRRYSKKKRFYRDLKGMRTLVTSLLRRWQVSKRIPGYYAYMRREGERSPRSILLEQAFWKNLFASVIVHDPDQIVIDKSEDQDGIVCIVILVDEEIRIAFECSLHLEIDLVIERDGE